MATCLAAILSLYTSLQTQSIYKIALVKVLFYFPGLKSKASCLSLDEFPERPSRPFLAPRFFSGYLKNFSSCIVLVWHGNSTLALITIKSESRLRSHAMLTRGRGRRGLAGFKYVIVIWYAALCALWEHFCAFPMLFSPSLFLGSPSFTPRDDTYKTWGYRKNNF